VKRSKAIELNLDNYFILTQELVPAVLIDWNELNTWTTNSPKKLTIDWFRKNLKVITESVKQIIDSIDRIHGRSAGNARIAREQGKSLTAVANQLLLGTFPKLFLDFMCACKEYEIWLPSTLERGIGCNEPCGEEAIVSPFNLGPEWIRYFMSVLYRKNYFKDKTRQNFFPFQNSDHLIHSVLVLLMGEVLFDVLIDDAAKEAVATILGDCDTRDIKKVKTLKDLMVYVYDSSHHSGLIASDTSVEDWLQKVWPLVALWHDVGYEAATWQLLTFREFSHSFAIKDLLGDFDIVSKIIRHLEKNLDLNFCPQFQQVFNCPEDVRTGYDRLWYTEGCQIQGVTKRAWGRLHALLSAFELSRVLKCEPENVVKHLSTAVALHHERFFIDDIECGELEDEQLAKVFVKNPILCLLQFADEMSGFARAKVVEMNKGVNAETKDGDEERYFDQIRFKVEWNKDPVCIWLPNEKTRPRFYKGDLEDSISQNSMMVKIRSLWGELMYDARYKRIDKCPRLNCRMGLL